MNQTQAIAKLRKTLGEKFAYRVDKSAPNAEQRDAIRVRYEAAKRIAEEADAKRKARYLELLQDPVYVQLKKAAEDTKAAAEKASVGLHQRRITVGIDLGLFFSVKAEGDNWAEVVATVGASK